MIFQAEKVLVIAPHTDDESIGCGGLIARLRHLGIQVQVVCFSTAMESIPPGFPLNATTNEFKDALAVFGAQGASYDIEVRKFSKYEQLILDLLRPFRDERYDLVIGPSVHDEHRDHSVVAYETLRAFWDFPVLSYEIPKRCPDFRPLVWIPLTHEDMMQKVRALECYKSQQIKKDFSGVSDVVLGNARTRGIQIGVEYAEAFEVPRSMILSPRMPSSTLRC
jgi:LmbE family N-acetylglucosaminyl deacetylase